MKKFPGSCYDGIQNPDEEGIDCGGKCQELCGKINYLKILICSYSIFFK